MSDPKLEITIRGELEDEGRFEGEAPHGGYWYDGRVSVDVGYGDRVATVETPVGCWGSGTAGTPESDRNHRTPRDLRDWEWGWDNSASEAYDPRIVIRDAIMADPAASAIVREALPDPRDVELLPLYIDPAMSGIATPEAPDLRTLWRDAVALETITYDRGVQLREYGVADLSVWLVACGGDDVCLFPARDRAERWARDLVDHREEIATGNARLLAMLDDDGACLLDGECLGDDD